ncbi:hypothetical protein GCM10009841_27870 [Microlunatus panaciterrae]|uniref:Glycosyltransferase involved in cell wall biosynthesis n=1 Tax=Microlunatus panaciterrae TaxID=400768 RepID=A0ABS2RHN4_9ACTN|nr:glycosyltransferase [Microlunatus panaciterrae]MBM7798516.1 glycosyltransferase involved in cell wall biosynthesis [Microlunatus panaciterrae]
MTVVDQVGHVVIAVLTYKRPADLAELLPLLIKQMDGVDEQVSVMVIDNDPAASARETVAGFAAVLDDASLVTYVHEPTPGIAYARNRALDEAADAHLLIFLDDDERPTETWLQSMIETYRRTGCAGAAGPVLPDYETEPDPWIVAGGFFVRKQFPDGAERPAAGSGNLLLDVRQLNELGPLRFDPEFGLTGGSDTVFTYHITRSGRKIIWSEGAAVVDKVPSKRSTRAWVLQRAFRNGNGQSRIELTWQTNPVRKMVTRLKLTAGGLARIAFGGLRAASGLLSRSKVHHARGSRTMIKGFGMLCGAWGVVYTEYGRGKKS